jgi:hypothetical protein
VFNARYNSHRNIAAPIVINSLAAGLIELGGVAAAATGALDLLPVSSPPPRALPSAAGSGLYAVRPRRR